MSIDVGPPRQEPAAGANPRVRPHRAWLPPPVPDVDRHVGRTDLIPRGRAALVLGGVLLLASLLRLVDLGRVGLNSDEAVYAGQAASLSGNPHFTPLFPVVRAHPLLMQVLMSPLYGSGVPDVAGRYVAAVFGVGTVALGYVLGVIMYGRRVGLLTALFLAVMPYHVVVSRQIILDGPMAFFATAALICMAIAASRPARARWLLAAGACLGLAALTKETAIILIGAAFVFLALANHLWRPVRYPLAAATVAVSIALAYPVLTAVAGASHSGQSYLLWQLTRRPNHAFSFYLVTVGGAMGSALLAAGAIGLLGGRWLGRGITWRETLLLSWAGVPLLFFEVWPVKGFTYLMALAPVVAVLAARALVTPAGWVWSGRREIVQAVATVVAVATLLVPTVAGIVSPTGSGLAGAGGTPGGREAGRWIGGHLPLGARLMTIGPSMANLVEYYSGRRADGLSVSANPLHRNPTYHAIDNADAELKAGAYQYIVWDAYSAARSPVFAARAAVLIAHFGGHLVHTERGTFHGHDDRPLVRIYAVTP